MNSDHQVMTSRPQTLLREGLLTSFARFPDKVAIICGNDSYTYAELLSASLSIANTLVEVGVKRGDRVAIYMDNTWPCVVSIYGALFAGATFLAINPQTKADKLGYMLDDSEAKVLITDNHLRNNFLPIVNTTSHLAAVILSGDDFSFYDDTQLSILSFDEIISNSNNLSEPVKVIPNDLAALIYTSGSTGFPKGVMQTHQSMVFAAWSLIEYQRLSEDDRILLVLPIAFDYGLYQLLMTVKIGATLIIERSFTFPAQVYKSIISNSITVFPAVPTILAMIISSHKKKALHFPSITKLTSTAADLPPSFIPYLHDIFPNSLIFKMYGLTECKRVCYLEPELLDLHPESVGRAIPGTETYLLSPEGQPVPMGEPGILYVRGPHIMAGYWKQPELSKAMLKPGKFPGERVLCTHDYFRVDEDELLYFIGRSDDIIKTRGEKVSPVEVEKVLQSFSGINEVCVVGVFDEILGQAIQAFVVTDSEPAPTEKEIKKLCLLHLENFMVPKEIVFLNSLPKTPNGKVNKIILKEMIANEIAHQDTLSNTHSNNRKPENSGGQRADRHLAE